MPDMLSMIGNTQRSLSSAQSQLATATQVQNQAIAAHDALVASHRATPDQLAASQKEVDSTWAKMMMAQGSVNKLGYDLNAQQQAHNAALTQSSSPTKQQAIASQIYSQAADVARNDANAAVKNAVATGQPQEVIDFYKRGAIQAEAHYQSMVNGSADDDESYIADIAGKVGKADQGEVDSQVPAVDPLAPLPEVTDETVPIKVTGTRAADHRIRIRPFGGVSIDQFMGIDDKTRKADEVAGLPSGTILNPLRDTGGVIFPFTPTIGFEQSINYGQMTPTHANTDYLLYQNTQAVRFTITAQFTAQTEEEGHYLLAALHFFRTASKMRFGANTKDKGFGPPVLTLSGYGSYMLNNLPIVLTSFSMELPANVNYVSVDTPDGAQFVPAITTFNIGCCVQQTPAQHRDDFIWEDFASGKLLSQGGWF